MPGYYYGFDMTYLYLVLPAIILSFWAQANVQGTYAKYTKIPDRRGYTGSMTARAMLDRAGLSEIPIERIGGNLTDHYDPTKRVLRLSESVYDSASIAAVGVAAHEVGHAIQHAEGYAPLKIRNTVIPVTNFISKLALPLIILGILFGYYMVEIGILMFGAAVLVQLITLPVEFNASSRAISNIESTGILDESETNGAKKVLKAAALTYVAATMVAIMQLLRLLMLANRNNRR